jgi:hypothetical protein
MSKPELPEDIGNVTNVNKVKKPYEKPSFRFEKVFETSALSCGKTPNQGPGQCSVARKAS